MPNFIIVGCFQDAATPFVQLTCLDLLGLYSLLMGSAGMKVVFPSCVHHPVSGAYDRDRFYLSCWMCSSDFEALIEQVFEARVV